MIIVFLIGNTLLCIETDENSGHKNYDIMDEQIRYDDLFQAFSGKWIYIRFNPDKFIDGTQKSINPSISTRLEKLKEEITKQIERIENNKNMDLVEIIYMFYDGSSVKNPYKYSIPNVVESLYKFDHSIPKKQSISSKDLRTLLS